MCKFVKIFWRSMEDVLCVFEGIILVVIVYLSLNVIIVMVSIMLVFVRLGWMLWYLFIL